MQRNSMAARDCDEVNHQKGLVKSEKDPRSPVITRSKSRSLALQEVPSTKSVQNSVDCASLSSVVGSNLKRKHSKTVDQISHAKRTKEGSDPDNIAEKQEVEEATMSTIPSVPTDESQGSVESAHSEARVQPMELNLNNSTDVPEKLALVKNGKDDSAEKDCALFSTSGEESANLTSAQNGCENLNLLLDQSLSVPSVSSFVTYSLLAQTEALTQPFSTDRNEIKFDAVLENIDLFNNENISNPQFIDSDEMLTSAIQTERNLLTNKPCGSEASSKAKLKTVIKASVEKKCNSDANNKPSASEVRSKTKVIRVVKCTTEEKPIISTSRSHAEIKNEDDSESSDDNFLKFSQENKSNISGAHCCLGKLKNESESGAKLIKLLKYSSAPELYKSRRRQHSTQVSSSSSSSSTSGNTSLQKESCCDNASKVKVDGLGSTEDMISVPFVSGMNSVDEDAGNASSSHDGATASGAATGRDGESKDSEIGRLQALLEARGIPLHVFGALGHRMQHLFHRSMGTTSSNRAHQLLQGLQATGDEGRQLQAVIEMCQLLVMGNEDTLIGFPAKQVVPVLISLLQMEHNFEMMNNACRALTYLMEALPRSSSVVVEAIPVFLNKLQFIQCMDVAEQSLTALEMLSRWHSKAILHARGIGICLMYLDFFSINAQRAALAVTANCCQNLLPDEFGLVQDSLSLLSGWLTHQDEKSIESICLAFSRLVDCFQSHPTCLKEIASQSLLSNIQQLLIVSPSVISTQTFIVIIRMLAVLCSSCSDLAVLLLKQNISETLCYLLIGGNSSICNDIKLIPRSHQELLEISCLICELMPQLPQDGIFSIDSLLVKQKIRQQDSVMWKWQDDSGLWHPYSHNDSKIIESAYQSGEDAVSLSEEGKAHTCTIDLNSMEQINGHSNIKRPLRRCVTNSSEPLSSPDQPNDKSNMKINCFEDNSELVASCIKSLFPVLYEIYCSSAGTVVRYNCLRAMLRMIYFASPDVLQLVLNNQMIARHIAAMLASQDVKVVVATLQMADILIQKLPTVFGVYFIREGVMHEIRMLSQMDIRSRQIRMPQESNSACNHSILRASANGLSSSSSMSYTGGGHFVSSFHISPTFDAIPSSSRSQRREDTHGNTSLKVSCVVNKKFFSDGRDAGNRKEFCMLQSSSSFTSDFYEKINTWIKERAESFDQYFALEQLDLSHPAVNVLNRLSTAVGKLESEADNGLEALIDICSIMTHSDISTFELVHSGLIKKLYMYLTVPQGNVSTFGASAFEKRLCTFLHVFMGTPLYPDINFNIENLNSLPLSSLISKLNACISHLEQFAVKVNDFAYGNIGKRGTSTLKFFNTHQLKCNFQRHPGCTNLRQWRGGPVMIDPLASIHNIDRYLVSQGYGVLKSDDEDEEDEESDQSDDDNSDEDMDDIAAAIRINQGQGNHKLQFLIGKNILPYNMTVYQAVRQYGYLESQNFDARETDSEDPVGYTSIWIRTHTIFYRPIPHDDAESSTSEPVVATQNKTEKKKRIAPDVSSHGKTMEDKVTKGKWDALWNDGVIPEVNEPLAFISDLRETSTIQDPSVEVIYLLRVIHALNRHWGTLYQLNSFAPAVPQTVFINNKLTLKANRQLQDLLAVMTANVPSWLSQIARDFPFLFPFQTRYLLFYVSSFDRERALQRLLEVAPEIRNTERITPKLDRRKKTVSRDGILKQAEAVFQDVGNSKALLEIQYKSEVGTGLGPTLEFYALVSKEFQRYDLDMWRGEKTTAKNGKGQSINYVYSPMGLYPMPLSKTIKSTTVAKICNKFKLLGSFLAKAIMDSRLLDIPLSPIFYKWMLNLENSLSVSDMKHIDENLAQSILKLEQLVLEKKKLEANTSLSPPELKLAFESLTLDGCCVEDLSLDFTLPGFSHIEMKKGGKDIPVSIYNLEEYLKLLKYWTMKEGIWRQMKAFREGFESVFSLNHLQIFYPDELEQLFCGSEHIPWDLKSLMDCCRPDHGYTYDSRAIKFFFDILSSYDQQQQRQFLQFVTGSPRLPVGGLKSLTPPLTIVRKTADGVEDSDVFLPSVMTCVNYLKLPDYTSIEIMREKLDIAISEGQHSFHLS